MALPTQLVHIRVPRELLDRLDQAAAKLFIDRSEYIRQAVAEKLRGPTTLPTASGVDILMTDKQLDDLVLILQMERRRRRYRGSA